jgi:hypothetical protein
MFPVKCNGCGYQLKDVYDLPCPKCGCDQATVSMAARAQAAFSGRATAVGHQTIEEMKKDWPYILLLIAVILVSGIPAYFLSGWTSVMVSWLLSILSAYVGYYALTKIQRSIRVF